jgi:hypothetical protein
MVKPAFPSDTLLCPFLLPEDFPIYYKRLKEGKEEELLSAFSVRWKVSSFLN